MKDKPHNKIGGPFAASLNDTRKAAAWKALEHGARSLFIELKAKYNRDTEAPVYLSTRDAVKALGSYSHRDNVRRWFRQLQYYGFIVMIESGHLGVNGKGKAPAWHLTDERYLGKPPSRDFLKWDGEPFNEQKPPSHYIKNGRFTGPIKQNPGPPVRSTLDHPFGPPWEKTQQKPGPPVQAISRKALHSAAEERAVREHPSGAAPANGVGASPTNSPGSRYLVPAIAAETFPIRPQRRAARLRAYFMTTTAIRSL